MLRWVFLGVLAISFGSCDHSEKNTAIVQEGIFDSTLNLELVGPCSIGSIQFANGKYCYELKGSFAVDSETYSYTILAANDPGRKEVSDVLSSSLSFNKDSITYRNSVLFFNDELILVWEFPGKRLKLEYSDSLISRH